MLNDTVYVRFEPVKPDIEQALRKLQYNTKSDEVSVVVVSEDVNVTVVLSLAFNHSSSIATEVDGAVRSTTMLIAEELTDSSELTVALAVTA